MFERQGDQMPDLTPGDLRVTLRTVPHRTCVRDGDNLYTKVALSLKEVSVSGETRGKGLGERRGARAGEGERRSAGGKGGRG